MILIFFLCRVSRCFDSVALLVPLVNHLRFLRLFPIV